MQTRNYPELFQQVSWWGAAVIRENFIPDERYKDGNRLGYLEVSDEILLSTGYTPEFIIGILVRMGSIFNLYIIPTVSELDIWIAKYTDLKKVWDGYEYLSIV